jgi:hypothetical protein
MFCAFVGLYNKKLKRMFDQRGIHMCVCVCARARVYVCRYRERKKKIKRQRENLTRGLRKLHSKELNCFCCSPKVVREGDQSERS